MKKSRRERREEERSTRRGVRDRLKLAELEPGGSASHPIDLVSASLVEPRAEATPCAACGSRVRVVAHDAVKANPLPLRIVRVLCPDCGLERSLYFRVVTQAN